jgi:NAD(P)-dependent dehydrogenase (short-subunit alcohol dehydrogenase family)
MELDLLSLASVRAFAKVWNERQVPLHVLVNNAGIFAMNGEDYIAEPVNLDLSVHFQ